MARYLPVRNEGARHALRRSLPVATDITAQRSEAHEDVAFFLVSFAAAFIILYGFII